MDAARRGSPLPDRVGLTDSATGQPVVRARTSGSDWR